MSDLCLIPPPKAFDDSKKLYVHVVPNLDKKMHETEKSGNNWIKAAKSKLNLRHEGNM